MSRNYQDHLDVVIAEKLFDLKVVGDWYCYMTDEDGWNVCDKEPEKWWSGSNETRPVYVVNPDEPIMEGVEENDIVFGYYRYNLKRVPSYTDSWDSMGRVIEEMKNRGFGVTLSTSKYTAKYTATIEFPGLNRILTVIRDSATLAMAEVVVKALESK